MVYLDNASTTYVYPEVITAINEMMTAHWANPSNLYQFGIEANDKVEEARSKIAKVINAKPEEIFFTSCSSESNALAINQCDICLCSPYEHHDIKENYKSNIVTETEFASKVAKISGDKKVLYAHMWVNNETGEIFNVKKLTEIAHENHCMMLVDATQALGNIPIDVQEIEADFMSFSFHKVHAPKGIGALYINSNKLSYYNMKPLIFGSQELGVRGGTQNTPYIVGAGVAVQKANKELDFKHEYTRMLKNTLLKKLREDSRIDFIVNQGNNNLYSILNISFKDISGEALMMELSSRGIYVSTGSACNSGDLKPSEVLTEMKVSEDYIQGAIRISFSLQNTMDDVISLAEAIKELYPKMTFKGVIL